MKKLLFAALSLLFVCSQLPAVEGTATANGVTVMGKEKTLTHAGSDKTITVNVTVKNGSFKELPEGDMDYYLIVERSNYTPKRLLLKGSGKIPALKTGQTFQVQTGLATYSQWWGTIKFYFKIVVKHDGKETVTVLSNPSFNSLAATSAPANEERGILAPGFNVVTGTGH